MNGDMANGPPPDPADYSLADLEALLAFHMEAGADWVLDETPHDRFAEVDAPPPRFAPAWAQPSRAQPAGQNGAAGRPAAGEATPAGHPGQIGRPAQPAARAAAPPAPAAAPANFASAADDVALQASEIARAATTLDALQAAMADFDGCSLKRTARQLVFGDGAPDARIMFVGEAPGAEEDRIGRPFVGRSGQLLDRMLAAIGLDRGKVYIANTVPWRPPGNRTPTPQESAICRPFIERQIALVAPDVLVCLGGPSAQALLGVREGILRLRGRWSTYNAGDAQIRALPTLHPAYLLRSPLQKRLAWRDFRAIQAALDESAAE